MARKHLVWDWNGTLLNDFGAVVSATNTVITEAGGPFLTAEEQGARFRRPIIAYYSELVGRSLTEAEFAELDKAFHAAYLEHLRFVDLHAESRSALSIWPGTQSLLSMWFHQSLMPLITRFDLAEKFALVQGLRSESDGHSKQPHLERHLESLQLRPQECVLIGDTVDDAKSALGLGAQVVLFTGGFSSREQLQGVGVPLADSLSEAVTIAQQL
ncbi:HAD family hydrolase [Natronoglycomyces albus]|uniref:HAD family hydrolase n=1 Tax=Natronoglycomyces albus TaxID=2811108 RepID=A0A895XQE1_9ACTN|nr:HAD hydrolase-like protein [Natronoglycomyces albus]QSB05589.1 HAD family hydrolase [Natronoglycomyces albus]